MDFAVGDVVLVVALKRRGEIVEQRGRAWRVAVGGLVLSCRSDELKAVESEVRGKGKRARTQTASRVAARTGKTSRRDGGESDQASHQHSAARGASSSIDLHGLTTEQAREALLRHLDEAMRAGHVSVDVVHGIGTGRVRAAVLDVLRGVPSVRHVRAHPTNRGVTVVDL